MHSPPRSSGLGLGSPLPLPVPVQSICYHSGHDWRRPEGLLQERHDPLASTCEAIPVLVSMHTLCCEWSECNEGGDCPSPVHPRQPAYQLNSSTSSRVVLEPTEHHHPVGVPSSSSPFSIQCARYSPYLPTPVWNTL